MDIILKQDKIVEHAVAKSYENIHNTLAGPCEKSKIVSFASSIMKNNLLLLPLRFPVKLICFIAFGSAAMACCLLKSIAIILCFLK